MSKRFNELAFHPAVSELAPLDRRGNLTVLTGGNNSGKSAYLKKMITDKGRLYLGVSRFYSIHYLPPYADNIIEQDQWFNNMNNEANIAENKNFENSFFNAATAITRLSNQRRELLLSIFRELFGSRAEVQPEDPNNEFSNRYIAVDGDSLSVTSSGTRLFLGLLSALMDERFTTVAIDEPELGLSPTLQRKLADIVLGGNRKMELFPHTPNIVLSTHSHHFLDKRDPGNNWVVSKSGNLISAKRCASFSELHDIQFRLLGNELGDLFLPDLVIFVEGETDKLFLDKVLAMHLPGVAVAIQHCGGDIASRLSYWAASLGDIQLSPYRERTLVIHDSVKQAGIIRACDTAGLPNQSRVEWLGNGVEFLYPLTLLREIFRSPSLMHSDLSFDRDKITSGEITYTKMELCKRVLDGIAPETILPREVEDKLLGPLRRTLGR